MIRHQRWSWALGLLLSVSLMVGCQRPAEPRQSAANDQQVESGAAGADQAAADSPQPHVTKRPITTGSADLGAMARDVVTDAGSIRHVHAGGTYGPVFVFEEFHTSRIGQHQIALMLLRLHDRYGLRQVGLEGAIQSSQPLDAGWFHELGGSQGARVREDVALRMLGEGEISAAEFITLVFADVQVHGLERLDQYRVTPDTEGNPVAVYLLKIAEKNLTQDDIRRINELLSDGKQEEALEYMTQADPWVREQFEALKNPLFSLQEISRRAREIRDKALELNVVIDQATADALEKTLHFYDVASQRSTTMAVHMAKLLAASAGKPSAMLIGAAHSDEIKEQLEQHAVSYVLVQPLGLNPATGNLSIEQFERKNDKQWARTSPGTLGGLLNSDRKPPPIIGTATGRSYASALFASETLALAVRGGKPVPDEVRDQLTGLPDCEVDFDSITVEGFDVIFRLTLKDTQGDDRQVWVRAGTTGPEESARSLEERLRQQIAELGAEGDADISPRDPPPNSDATRDVEGPADGKRGDVVISRLSSQACAVFGESLDSVATVGRISG